MEAKISNVKIGKRKLFGFEHIIKDTRSREEEENIPDDISIGSSSSRTENAISKGAIQKSIIFKKHGLSRFSPQKLISPVKSIKNFIAKRSNNNKEESKIINNPPESPASPDRIVSGKFRLRGKYLSYYSKNEGMVITLDITECKVRLGTSEVLEDGKLKFTYFIATKDKEHCFTSFSEKSRLTSMMILHEQVQAYKSIVKALVNPVEVCLGFGVVNRRRTAMLTSATFSTVTMALTSQHRILFFQQSSTSLQEQVTWTINHPPLFIKVFNQSSICIIDNFDVCNKYVNV